MVPMSLAGLRVAAGTGGLCEANGHCPAVLTTKAILHTIIQMYYSGLLGGTVRPVRGGPQ
jgi:hypothetical protein